MLRKASGCKITANSRSVMRYLCQMGVKKCTAAVHGGRKSEKIENGSILVKGMIY
jgi:hypothetical protein